MHKIGIMGGTFDPIHNGHLIAAEEVMQQLSLDKVIFVPVGTPPIKDAAKTASACHRHTMCVLATCDNYDFFVSTIEIDREGTSYTVDTISQLTCEYPGAELFFIVGADVIGSFHKWRKIDDILLMCRIVVTNRPGSVLDEEMLEKYGDRVIPAEISDIDISSTWIRGLLERGESVRYLLPRLVHDYIRKEGVYDGKFAHFKRILRIDLSAERYSHSLAVVGEAENLGRHYGQDEVALEKLRLAALLHDCAKNFCDERPLTEIDALCRSNNIALDEFCKAAPSLAHSFAGAALAKAKYGVGDEAVLDAIASHTFGKSNMTTIDKVIYIADFIEPTRASEEARSHARKLAYEDLDAAMIYILRHTIEKTTARGLPVHKDSMAALENLEGKNYGKKG